MCSYDYMLTVKEGAERPRLHLLKNLLERAGRHIFRRVRHRDSVTDAGFAESVVTAFDAA